MRKGLCTAAVVFGAAVTAVSLVVALAVFLLAGLLGNSLALVIPSTVAFAIGIVGCGLGMGMAWAGWSSLQGRVSSPLRLPAPWLLIGLFAFTLIAGELALRAGLAAALLPPLHVLASLLPPLIVIAIVTRPLQRAGAGLTQRDLLWQLSYGALAATLLAGLLETASLLFAGAWGVLLIALIPGAQDRLLRWNEALLLQPGAADPQALLSLLASPAMVLAIGLILAVLAPAIEEVAKSLGVGLAASGRGQLNRGRAFALGVMAGVGFSFVEALFYGVALLPDGWISAVAMRASTAAMHGLATGLMGLAWYMLLVSRRPWQFAGYALAAIGLHGAWNALSGLVALASRAQGQSGVAVLRPVEALLPTMAGSLLVLLFFLAATALVTLPYLLGGELRTAYIAASSAEHLQDSPVSA